MHSSPTFPKMGQYVVVLALVASMSILVRSVAGRDLRPADHGLAYQEDSFPPAENGDVNAQEIRSFFGSTTSNPETVELPEAKNISDAVRSGHAEGGRSTRDAGRDHVRLWLLVASAVCGLTGIVLLTVSGVVFLIRRAKAERQPSTPSPTFEAVNKGSV